MRYYLDTEFDGMGGPLMSLALVREDNSALYFVVEDVPVFDPWVQENVVPLLFKAPQLPVLHEQMLPYSHLAHAIEYFLHGDNEPHIVTDWPSDIQHFCEAVITGPGKMIDIPRVSFEVVRVDAYPTTVEGALQHNAYWDAMALKAKLEGMKHGL